jgi:putative transposase
MGCHQYFLTICTFERRQYFPREDLVCGVRSTFLRTASELQFAISAYCFMPDHIHILAEGTAETADLRAFVNTAKISERRSLLDSRQIVAGWLLDRVLRETDSAYAVARYIVQNPVRAGLARSPIEHPFCGSSTWSKEELVESTMWRPGGP